VTALEIQREDLTPERAPRDPLAEVPDLAALCRAIAERPTPPRLATKFPTLDKATRGGIPAGRRVVLVAPPGAGKTTLAAQWSHDWAIAGARVVYLAMDQDPEAILVRLGQREGLDRDNLEGITGPEAKHAAWLTLADRLAPLPLRVLDGADTTVETALAALRALPGDGPIVLVLDSLQTIRCAAAEPAETPRARMDTILDVLRRAAATIVGVSEMNRGGYLAGRASPTDTIAAAKESGAIEFWADLLIGLRSVKGEADLVDVDIAKNRLGVKCELRLRLSFARALLTEAEGPDEDAGEPKEADAGDLDRRILRAVCEQEIRSIDRLAAAVHVRTGVASDRAGAILVKVGGRYRPRPNVATEATGAEDAGGVAALPALPGNGNREALAPLPAPIGGNGNGKARDVALARAMREKHPDVGPYKLADALKEAQGWTRERARAAVGALRPEP
jgi:KaiC/GvpD/RAD55 family RecA-like ATPase